MSIARIQISLEEFGQVRTVDLKPEGADISVTSENKEGSTDLSAASEQLCKGPICRVRGAVRGLVPERGDGAAVQGLLPRLPLRLLHQSPSRRDRFPFNATGFTSSPHWQLLRPEEIELLVCGCPNLDLEELRKVAVYDGFKSQDKTIR